MRFVKQNYICVLQSILVLYMLLSQRHTEGFVATRVPTFARDTMGQSTQIIQAEIT
jgi:hypothetical protein